MSSATNDATLFECFPAAARMQAVAKDVDLEPVRKKLAKMLRVIQPMIYSAAEAGQRHICIDAKSVDLAACSECGVAKWLGEKGYEASCGTHGLFISWKEAQ